MPPARLPPIAALLLSGLICADSARALEPYEDDGDTLHLWHLDEAGPPFANAVEGGPPLLGLLNGAEAGRPALAGLGRAVSLHHDVGGVPGESSLRGAILLLAPELSAGPADNAPPGFRYTGEDGAFTYEALVKLDELPEDAEVIALTILSMDGESEDRVFHFRIERQGFLAFTPLPNSGATGGALAQLPRSGPHALNTRDWFHVAVTYDGRAGVPNNTHLYWTRVAADPRRANRIGSGSLSANFSGTTGDFAIGNEARSFNNNAEAEPFPGRIDEVRISSVARDAAAFIFTDPSERPTSKTTYEREAVEPEDFQLKLARLLVNGQPSGPGAGRGGSVSLPAGLHRLDFDLAFPEMRIARPLELRCQLDGFDERWLQTARGMEMVIQVLDVEGRVISEAQYSALGSSPGWANRLVESELTPRSELLFLPAAAESLRITLNSGPPDTTGSLAIDDLAITLPTADGGVIWQHGFNSGANLTSPAGVPNGWERTGSDPAIAQVLVGGSSPALALVDGDQSRSGGWMTRWSLPPGTPTGRTAVVSWNQAHTVISGGQQRATYLNVPPGEYVFRAFGLVVGSESRHVTLALPLEIRSRLWDRAWFWPLVTAACVALLALAVVRGFRRRARRRLRELEFQNVLERDRIRIARDLHDDLGARVTLLNFSASLAQQELERSPEIARRHLGKLGTTARDLVVAMDDLVWAVDPAHDTLEHLASHLARVAEELFRDSPIRCRLDIPANLPDRVIGSDFRHHLALAVKEALHNVLRHARASEVRLTFRIDGPDLVVTVADDGCGFEASEFGGGHGLANFQSRMEESRGSCEIRSSPGEGTTVTFRSPLERTRPKSKT